jgi:hypothetical protein
LTDPNPQQMHLDGVQSPEQGPSLVGCPPTGGTSYAPLIPPDWCSRLQGLSLDWLKVDGQMLQGPLQATLRCCSSLRKLSLVGYPGSVDALLSCVADAGAAVTHLNLQHSQVNYFSDVLLLLPLALQMQVQARNTVMGHHNSSWTLPFSHHSTPQHRSQCFAQHLHGCTAAPWVFMAPVPLSGMSLAPCCS